MVNFDDQEQCWVPCVLLSRGRAPTELSFGELGSGEHPEVFSARCAVSSHVPVDGMALEIKISRPVRFSPVDR